MTNRIRALVAFGATSAIAVVASPAAAQKTDVVTMVNGDTITGEIKGIDKGLLRLSTSGMGTVEIKWSHIAAIQTDKTLEIELSSGPRVYGALQPDEQGGIAVVLGAESQAIDLDDVAEGWPVGKSFWQKQDGKLDLGFSLTQASSQAQYNLNVTNTFNGRRYRIPLKVASAVTTVDNETTTNRHVVEGAWIRDLKWSRWFGIAVGGYQRNDELDLDSRVTGGGGAGRYLLQSSRSEWGLYGAVIGTQERYSEGTSQTGASAIVGTNLGLFIYGDHDLSLDIGAQVIPSLSGSSRLRVEFTSSVNYELVSRLYLGLNFYDQYDSNPPQETALRNDFGVSSTVGYKW